MTALVDQDLALAVYVELDQAVDAADAAGLRARWAFGRAVLAERGDRARLPNRRLDEIALAVGKSRAEIKFRMHFALDYPTAAELANAVSQFESWHAYCNQGEVSSPLPPTFDAPEPVKTYTEILPGSCPYCRHAVTIQAVYDPVGDHFRILWLPEGKVGQDWFPGDEEDT